MKGYSDVPVPLQNDVSKVFSGEYKNCVIKLNYKVYCWGDGFPQKFIKPFKDDPRIIDISIAYFIWAI